MQSTDQPPRRAPTMKRKKIFPESGVPYENLVRKNSANNRMKLSSIDEKRVCSVFDTSNFLVITHLPKYHEHSIRIHPIDFEGNPRLYYDCFNQDAIQKIKKMGGIHHRGLQNPLIGVDHTTLLNNDKYIHNDSMPEKRRQRYRFFHLHYQSLLQKPNAAHLSIDSLKSLKNFSDVPLSMLDSNSWSDNVVECKKYNHWKKLISRNKASYTVTRDDTETELTCSPTTKPIKKEYFVRKTKNNVPYQKVIVVRVRKQAE